jgi:hypothetical protein
MNSKHMPLVIAWATGCIGVTLLLGNLLSAETADVGAPQDDAAGWGDQQRLFDRINVPEAWEITKGDPEVIVGMIDNGYDFFHPDLEGQLIPGYYYSGGFHTEFYAGNAHGTLVASIIAARDDGAGMVGLAPRCKVLTASQGMLEHTLVKMRQEYFKKHPKATLADWQEQMGKHQDELASSSEAVSRMSICAAVHTR